LDRLVIYRLDRLSRDLRHFVNLGQELREHKVGLTVVAAPELGVAALDNLMLNVLASFAEFEREMAASRIAEARAYMKVMGAGGRRRAVRLRGGPSHEATGCDPRRRRDRVEDVPVGGGGGQPFECCIVCECPGMANEEQEPWTARQVLFTLAIMSTQASSWTVANFATAAIKPWWREAFLTRFRTASLCGAPASRDVGGGPFPGCFAGWFDAVDVAGF
jgi:hypothetical protein